MIDGSLDDIAVEGSAQTAVCSHDNEESAFCLPADKQRIEIDIDFGYEMAKEVPQFSRIRARRDDRLLRPAKPGSGDHFHSLGDFLGVPDTSDPTSYFAQCCHALQVPDTFWKHCVIQPCPLF